MSSKPVTTLRRKPIHSVRDYLSVLEQAGIEGSDFVFRGHRDKRWQLLPVIARQNGTDFKEVLRCESVMLEEFKTACLMDGFIDEEFARDDDWNWLALARHCGLPTRLLDWTACPLVALWFAVRTESNESVNGMVWVFRKGDPKRVTQNLAGIKPFDTNRRRTRFFTAGSEIDLIKAQKGQFAICYPQFGRTKFIKVENIKDCIPLLSKVQVASGKFEEIRRELADRGVTEAKLFPRRPDAIDWEALEDICGEIAARHDFEVVRAWPEEPDDLEIESSEGSSEESLQFNGDCRHTEDDY